MNIKERVSIHFTELTKTDRKIVSQLFTNPNILINQSIQKAAEALEVSSAAIMRTVKKLDYRGLAEFKLALEEMNQEEIIAVPEKSTVSQVVDTYQQMLTLLERTLDEPQMIRIARDLAMYHQVKVLGLGSSGLSAEQLVYSLLYQDEYVESITSRTKIFYLARALTKEMYLVIYSVSGNLTFYQELFEKAKEQQSKVVLITMNRDEHLQQFVDEVVVLPSNLTNFSDKNGLRQLDNRFVFYVFSEILATYFDQINDK